MLVNAGIKRIYAVTGDSLDNVNDAVRREGNIQWIHVRHEEAGAFAASAEAQLAGLAICAGSLRYDARLYISSMVYTMQIAQTRPL